MVFDIQLKIFKKKAYLFYSRDFIYALIIAYYPLVNKMSNTVAYQPPTDRLNKYANFVRSNSINGVYSPEKGLESLLTTLTPDLKVVVLQAMNDSVVYSTQNEIYRALLQYLSRFELASIDISVDERSPWHYLEYVDRSGRRKEGSLVQAGVVDEVTLKSSEGMKVGYSISCAGKDLAIPLGMQAMDFVYRARNSSIPHRFDSMWKLLGTSHSRTENKRQFAVYNIVKFLRENSGYYRTTDLAVALSDKVDLRTVGKVLDSLGESGVIGYESPTREVNGARAKGWSTYCLNGKIGDFENTYALMISEKPYFRERSSLFNIIQYMEENPDSELSASILVRDLSISGDVASVILMFLERLRTLRRKNDFTSHTKTKASANDLTRMFYDTVLAPAWEAAAKLNPVPHININPEKLSLFLENYQEERTQIGQQGGQEARDVIVGILTGATDPRGLKLSQIVQEGNGKLDRRLARTSYFDQLQKLIASGVVEKTESAYYRFAPQESITL